MFAFELLDEGKFYVPIPSDVYYPLRLFTQKTRTRPRGKKRKRQDENPIVPQFIEFINSPSKLHSVYEYGSSNTTVFVDSVFHFFNQFDPLRSYWDSQCRAGNIFSKQCRMMYVYETDGRVLTEKFMDKNREYYDTRFIQSALYSALEHGISCAVPLFMSLLAEGDEHANMGFLKYDPGTNTVSCTIFEPHATQEDVDPTVRTVKSFLEGIVESAGLASPPTLRVTSPWHEKGLQGGSPICVQWSLLMFFTFMLNCEVGGGGCNLALEKELLMHVFKNRSSIMPIWMYYMDTTIVRSKFVPGGGEQVDMGEEFDPDTELDVYGCSEQKAPCSYPCAPREDGDGCYNKLLFPPKIK